MAGRLIRLPLGVLVALYAAALAAPIALALAYGAPERGWLRELAGALAMAGFAMLLAEFVLSGRFRAVSDRAGIDATMRFHQLAARVLLVLLVLHPLLYMAPRLFASERLQSGVAAWMLLLLLVPLAIWRDRLPIRYEAWRLSHGLGAAAIAAAGLHHTLQVGTWSGEPWLAGYWIAMSALALLSLAYVYALKPLLQLRHPYRVVSNRPVAQRMWEVTLEPERGAALDFAPGQFVWLNLGHSPFNLVEHPFSISSAPADRPRIAFIIKESGDFTRRIGTIAPGTRAYLDGPHGSFSTAGRPLAPIAFIAGGVGFAPIIGMLRELAAQRHAGPLRVVYGNRIEAQVLYREETEALKARLDLRVDYVFADLTPEVLAERLDMPERAAWLYFVCGPTPMMDSVARALHSLGVPRQRIISERFSYA